MRVYASVCKLVCLCLLVSVPVCVCTGVYAGVWSGVCAPAIQVAPTVQGYLLTIISNSQFGLLLQDLKFIHVSIEEYSTLLDNTR